MESRSTRSLRNESLGREADLDALALDKLDDLDGGAGDVRHVLAVRELAQEGRGADDDVDAVDTGLDGDAGVVHVTADVGQDLGAEAELADGLAVQAGTARWRRAT